ncbi:MAG: bacterial Ig-like domain-containing protein, partial [Treponema sp.]|nr:bacterial Ig-like domain-containing protein [Treponema sp.]
MKNTIKLFGFIALIVIIGFSMTGCDSGGGDSDPKLTGTVSIEGTAQVGETLEAITSALNGKGTISYQWKRGTTIVGTNSETYQVQTVDIGSTITVTVTRAGYTGSKTSEPTATVIAAPSGNITYTAVQTGGEDNVSDSTGIVFTFSASVDSLNLTADDITVGGAAAKGAAGLTGSGTTQTLSITVSAAGNATVRITKTGIEADTKNVTVYKTGQTTPTLTGITANYTGGSVEAGSDINLLKSNLTVKAQYSDSTEITLSDNEYELSGTLTVGLKTITVIYEGEETTFNVTVTGGSGSDITYTAVQTGGEDNVSDSTGIVLTFSASVDSLNLTADDITVGGAAAKGAAGLTGTGTTRTLSITVSEAGNATVSISKTGIEADTKNVTVYKAGQTTPTLTGDVSISGIAKVGETLTADTSALDGSGTITYQWKRGTIDIGTNSSTYQLVPADVGSTITVTVTRAGYSGSKTSGSTPIVTDPDLPELTGKVT